MLTIVGTALVGGSIISHGIPALHHLKVHLTTMSSSLIANITPILTNAVIGIIAGGIMLLLFQAVKKWLPQKAARH